MDTQAEINKDILAILILIKKELNDPNNECNMSGGFCSLIDSLIDDRDGDQDFMYNAEEASDYICNHMPRGYHEPGFGPNFYGWPPGEWEEREAWLDEHIKLLSNGE